MSREKIKKIIIEFLGTIVGSAVMAFGVSSFLLPNQLSSGGFSGVATITYYLLNIPMGLMIMILNVPLFILAGYKHCIANIYNSLDIMNFILILLGNIVGAKIYYYGGIKLWLENLN